MKFISSVGLFCLITLLACGEPPHYDETVPKADSVMVRAYEKKSISCQNTKPDSAIYFANAGLKLSRHLQFKLGEALMLNRFARINEQYGNLQLAMTYQEEALIIFNKLHDNNATADASANLGMVEGKQGNFNKGVRLIQEALSKYEKNKDTLRMIRGYTQLGEINELSKNSAKALQYYSKAEQLNKDMPASDEYFALISSLGNLHTKLGNHQQAADFYETGISKSGAKINARTYIKFLNHAGKTFDTLGDKKKSLAYHQLGLQKAREEGLPEEEARSLMGIATTLKNQDAEMSIEHLKHALIIADSIGHKQLSADIYQSLSDVYRQQSHYQEALTALEQHHRLLDSVLNENKGHKLAVLQGSYELADSKLHIETLELANERKTYQRNVGIYSSIAALIILLVLAGYFYKTRRLNKRLEASNTVKDKLFSIIGHDLRNPIGGITQLLAMVEEEEDMAEDERKIMISAMRKQADTSLEILNALLKWGQAQLKGVQIEVSTFDPKSYITINTEALHMQAKEKNINVIDYTSPGLKLFGDVNHFDFIIRNLVSNAIKFSNPSGKIEIKAGDSESNFVTFSVKDHGKGISKIQQQLFAKSNLDVTFGTKGEKGTGIGLMLCKEFIRANGGRLWIESEEGKGTTFYFTFPSKN